MGIDLDWDGCENIRDLGGVSSALGYTALRVYVRGDNARKLTDLGWRQAFAYGIRGVLDLRSETECLDDPPQSEGFTHTRISLFEHYDDDPAYRADFHERVSEFSIAEKYCALYNEALDLDRERFAEALAVLANAQGGVLFHCVGGKDRTGVLAALVLRLAGATTEAIEADYIRTEERANRATATHIDRSAPAHVITEMIGDLEARYGSTAGYLLAAGASTGELEAIIGKLIPDDSRFL
jgi:protein-tyrosine phosphatase